MGGPGTDADESPPVQAIRVATGVGKTRIAARMIADRVRAGAERPFAYAVPTHRLGTEIVSQFHEHEVSARVFRGRSAPDPDRPGRTMCDDLDAVDLALKLGAPVQASCCKGKAPSGAKVECAFFDSCSYQRQMNSRPQVWIIAHQLLFHAQAGIGPISGLFIDESFWQAGIWTARRGLTLDEIQAHLPLGPARLDTAVSDLESYRARLARALREQTTVGGVRREHLARHLSDDDCANAIALEWRLKDEPALYPGMSASERRKAALAARGIRHIRSFVRAWTAARELLREDPGTVSGRLFLVDLDGDHGVSRAVRTRGVRPIAQQWKAPTFIMDATLPDKVILERFFPAVEILADIDAAAPHVAVRQVLGAPVSAKKLIRQEGARNLIGVRRALLHRHLEFGRQPTLVVAQKAAAEWLKASVMPPGIAVEHFNNVSGLDRYKDVRLLIVIGRTLPGVFDVEALAGALTGLDPVKTAQPDRGPRWYEAAVRGIRLKAGGGVGVACPAHPDPVAEACRWQICEGELVQAVGRGRGVNRTAETPLDVEIWADIVLPVVVDAVLDWSQVPIGAEVEMMVDGMLLESPSDMAACWPAVWATEKAARRWRESTAPKAYINTSYRGFRGSARYQPAGVGRRWRAARFDPDVIADPRAWLEARLGRLAAFELCA